MAVTILDLKGLKCPQPTLRLTNVCMKAQPGDIYEVTADCDTFEKDIKTWCERMKKTLLWLRTEDGNVKRAQVQM